MFLKISFIQQSAIPALQMTVENQRNFF